MQTKKTNYLPLIFLPIIIFLCFGLWISGEGFVSWTRIDSETGVFDMRNVDFHNTIAGTTRTVEYIPGELLTPEEFAMRDDIRVGKVPSETKVSTMRVRYLVPDDIVYGIAGYSVNYASKVYINGKWIFNEGKPALTSEDEQNSESYHLFSAQPVDGAIEIVIASSCFVRTGSSSGMDWYVGEYQNMRVHHTRTITQDIIVMSFYIFLAIMSLLLFFVLPEFKATGWLTLLTLVWALRAGLKSEKILLTLFPVHTWEFVYKTEIITSPLTILLLAFVLHSVFTGALPTWLRAIIMGGSALAALAVVILPLEIFRGHSAWSNPIIYWTLAVMLGFILFSMRRTRTRPALSQIIILIGMGLLVLAFMWDENYFGNGSAPFAITQPMMLVFAVFMLVAAILETMRKTALREVQLAVKVEMQEIELLETRIAIMLSQIQPHFLYNSLTAIKQLYRQDPQKGEETLMEFSDYLRGNMDSLINKDLVTFDKELHHVETYLSIEKKRFGDKVNITIDAEARDFSLPALTLQPIVENAVRYGITKNEDGGTITILTAETETSYTITVTDNGAGFDPSEKQPDERSHVGIENVRTRLHAMCGGRLEIQSKPGVGTTVVITIPKRRGER